MTCCPEFEAACQPYTDNEGVGPLVFVHDYNHAPDRDDLLHIGDGLKPIRFCPWCGKKIQVSP